MIPAPTTPGTDLRRAPLATVRAIDLRAAERDFWADEAALWDRFEASWAGLDDAAWRLPGAAPSDAGGPDWSLAEHVGHVADWQELATDYVAVALETGGWPSDDDYDGGDFDTFNERRREPWASMPPAGIRARLRSSRERLLAVARRLPLETIRGDDGWGWVYLTLHGHRLDHLVALEPWADALRLRQVDGDPFVDDPRPVSLDAFWAEDAAVSALFDELVRPVPLERWTGEELSEGWALREHVAHVADWAEDGVRAIGEYRATGTWPADPEEGIDAWNERQVARWRDATPDQVLARFDRELARVREAIAGLTLDELRTPDGWGWAYDCLHGHLRKHLALVGPWCAASRWPDQATEPRTERGDR
jgi:hypothetical protein